MTVDPRVDSTKAISLSLVRTSIRPKHISVFFFAFSYRVYLVGRPVRPRLRAPVAPTGAAGAV